MHNQENNRNKFIALSSSILQRHLPIPFHHVNYTLYERMLYTRKVLIFSDTRAWMQTSLRVMLFHIIELVIQGDKRMNAKRKHLSNDALRYKRVVGTGGIGTGMFFLLEGNHTLGRNESRAAKLVPFKDYCKLHIISHYLAVLLGAGRNEKFRVWPIGKVGDDEAGRLLIEEMERVGMQTPFIGVSADADTMFSVCFQYADSTGGNITTSNSASERVTPEDIVHALSLLQDFDSETIVLAAPEVPLPARIELLRQGRRNSAFNAASLLASEVDEFGRSGAFAFTDYLSINIDEAKAIAGITDQTADSRTIVDLCVHKLESINDQMLISVTDGPFGCYGYSNGRVEFVPPLQVEALGTGGAGDAFFAGTIAGMACGLPFMKGTDDRSFGETPIESALELGTLVASLSVTSPDTIHRTLDAGLLLEHAAGWQIDFSDRFQIIFI
jgi:sugar/nucleoside kinase (ribokinase family)